MIIVDEQACSIIQMTSISRQEKKVITYNMSSVTMELYGCKIHGQMDM